MAHVKTISAMNALAVAALVACGPSTADQSVITSSPDGQSVAPPAAAVEQRDNALVRFVHAVPAGATVDVYADENRAFQGVDYKTVTPYQEVPGERSTIQLRPTDAAQSDPIASNSEGLNDGSHYTILALPGDGDAPELRVIEDDFSAPAPGKARVRVVHASPDAGELDVYAAEREELFDGVNARTVTGYDEIDPWTGSLQVRAEGGERPLATVPDTRFEAGKVYTVVVVGTSRTRPALEAFVIEDDVRIASR